MSTGLPLPHFVSRRSVLSSAVLLAENFVRLGLVAVVSLWIAHALGPAMFGLLNYASAVVAVAFAGASLGLEAPLVRRLAQGEAAGTVLGSALWLRAGAAAVAVLAVIAAVALMRNGEPLVLVVAALAALSIPLTAPLVVDAWFKTHNEALRPALARTAATLLSCALKAGCLLLGFGVVALAVTVAIEGALITLALLWAYRSVAGRAALRALWPQPALVRALLHDSLPFVASIAAIAAMMKVDVILLGVLADDHAVGVYSLCQKLSEVLYVLPVIVAEVLYPELVRRAQGRSGARDATQTFFDALFAVALAGTLLAVVLVGWLVPAVFGEPYRDTVPLFQVHAWSCLGIALMHGRLKWLAAQGLQRQAPFVALAGLGIVLACNIALIPPLGAAGAALATVLAYALAGFGLSLLLPDLRPVARAQWRALWPWGRLWTVWHAR